MKHALVILLYTVLCSCYNSHLKQFKFIYPSIYIFNYLWFFVQQPEKQKQQNDQLVASFLLKTTVGGKTCSPNN